MKRILLVLFALVAPAVLLCASCETAGSDPHDSGFARTLLANPEFKWETYPLPHGHLHFTAGSYAAQNASALATAIDHAANRVLSQLQLADTAAIEVFLVESRAQMRELVGRPIAGMVQSGERTAVLVANADYDPFVLHELTHLYSHYHWGAPVNGRWLSEGLAMLASGDCQEHSIEELGKGLLEDGKVLSWTEFVRDFDTLDEVTANLHAASMVHFVNYQLGPGAVRELWQSRGWQALEQMWQRPIAEIERLWRDRLGDIYKSARLDVERLHEHGCK